MMILLVEGSPRKDGNGSFLADRIESKYSASGVRRLRLRDMSYRGCIGCRKCRENNSFCVLEDDMSPVFELLSGADKIILLSPNYYGHVRGEVKQFLDRLYCMKDASKASRYKQGAKLVFLLTQGSLQRDKGAPAVEWVKKLAEHSQLQYYGLTVPGCSFDHLDGVKMKEEEIMMGLSFFS